MPGLNVDFRECMIKPPNRDNFRCTGIPVRDASVAGHAAALHCSPIDRPPRANPSTRSTRLRGYMHDPILNGLIGQIVRLLVPRSVLRCKAEMPTSVRPSTLAALSNSRCGYTMHGKVEAEADVQERAISGECPVLDSSMAHTWCRLFESIVRFAVDWTALIRDVRTQHERPGVVVCSFTRY